MLRRNFLALSGAGLAARGASNPTDLCGCAMAPQAAAPGAFAGVQSGVKITGMKVFGVSLTRDSDRPYVFVKLETDQGVAGWGEGTLEGKAGAVMACVNDFRDFLIGADPMRVEHHWQSMYVQSFYRAGPVIGSAISGIDQALWDIRGKVLGMPVYRLLGGPLDGRGVRGYYHATASTKEQLARLRETAVRDGVSCFKSGIPGYYEWIETHAKIDRAVKSLQFLPRGSGAGYRYRHRFPRQDQPQRGFHPGQRGGAAQPAVHRRAVPAGERQGHASASRAAPPRPSPPASAWWPSYGCRELIEMGVVDILQTDINHVGGVSGLWKVGAMAGFSGISMAPHACEGPIGGLATLHVDAAMPNFLVQEICGGVTASATDKIWEEWFGFPAMRMVNGRFPLPEKPGLGFELSEASLAKYPFGGTRPMARAFHEDGSVAEW